MADCLMPYHGGTGLQMVAPAGTCKCNLLDAV